MSAVVPVSLYLHCFLSLWFLLLLMHRNSYTCCVKICSPSIFREYTLADITLNCSVKFIILTCWSVHPAHFITILLCWKPSSNESSILKCTRKDWNLTTDYGMDLTFWLERWFNVWSYLWLWQSHLCPSHGNWFCGKSLVIRESVFFSVTFYELYPTVLVTIF